ncbi:hypothetical protein GHT06_021507 [Daphnia sinensis]|uniref:Uncharacterized protein n=1 Tax=Daphnia sinensis TaxID=1820382 RepID=A0AAD5L0D5_9CRUS|nr:hypothetical protein GHT06_021507 [Daphnia sinensis]
MGGRSLSSTAGCPVIDDGRFLRSHANDLYRFTKCLVLLLLLTINQPIVYSECSR